MRFLTPFVYLIAIAAVAIIGIIVWLGVSFRQFETIEAAGDLDCTPVIGVYGPADIEPVAGTKEAYLSSYDRRGKAERGAILRFDTANPLESRSWRDRTAGTPRQFVPMGIDLYQDQVLDGRRLERLFVVNSAGPEVLIYDIDTDGDLVLRERLTDPRLVSPNDVVATGPRSFYVTNETSTVRESWRGRLEFLLGLRTGQILHYDGNSWSDVASDMAFPNGLALSEDGETLFVAQTRAKTLSQFDRDPETDVLAPKGGLSLQTFPDNLSIDDEGSVIIGTIPQPFSFEAYGKGLREKAPSALVRVNKAGTVETIFQDPGEELSAATVGVHLDETLLIGSRAADRFLMCQGG